MSVDLSLDLDALDRMIVQTTESVRGDLRQWEPDYPHPTYRPRKQDVHANINMLRGLLLARATLTDRTLYQTQEAFGIDLRNLTSIISEAKS